MRRCVALRCPFLVTGPAAISFSGGRTSAMMLYRIIDAHGGTLPEDVIVAFCNTGREMPATLDFVRDCGAAWNVPVVWLEYRWEPGAPSFEVVSHNSASRDGEPMEMLFRSKSMLPNPVMRFCTTELKVRTVARYLRSLGWEHWTSALGLRADEPERVERALGSQRDRWTNACPLAAAGIEQQDVFAFWKRQPFDLRLKGAHEGNCDGCFLKSRAALERMHLDHPERMAWWEAQERQLHHGAGTGATFRADREDYATMARTVRDQGRLPFDWTQLEPCLEGCGV